MHNHIQQEISQEAIASGVRQLISGIPQEDVSSMMKINEEALSAIVAQYNSVLSFLVTEKGTTNDGRRFSAYLSDYLAQPMNFIEGMLQHCKLNSTSCIEAASHVRALLKSGRRLANLYLPEEKGLQAFGAAGMVFVTAQMTSERYISGDFRATIDDLRWKSISGTQQYEELIIEEPLEFRIEGIFADPIDAIRAFYTSPVDVFLLGKFLLQK